MPNPASSKDLELQLARDIAGFVHDPVGYVYYAYPWQTPGTILANHEGPDKWQMAELSSLGKDLETCHTAEEETSAIQHAIASGHGIGKASPKSLIINDIHGERRWGDIKPGDYVFGPDGQPTRVLATHEQGVKAIYRVSFDDGSSTLACAEHLWSVRGRQQRRKGTNEFVTMTTQEIFAAGVLRRNGSAMACQWEIPQHDPVEFLQQDVPAPPYAIGVWLGDGCRCSGTFVGIDPEVFGRLAELGVPYRLSKHPQVQRIRGLVPALRQLGILEKYAHQKRVPTCYLYNTSEVRAEMLRGLLDTDGECSKQGCINFSSTSKGLVEDVIWLTRSLGGKASLQPTIKKPFYYNAQREKVAGRDCYRATLRFPEGFRAFYTERRQERVKPCQARYLARWIKSIEYSHHEEAMCITVAHPSSLYLTKDFIVTHNSAFMSWVIQWFVSTAPNANIVATANTRAQLLSKLWRELARWHKLMLNGHWFEWTATAFYHKDHKATWRANAIPWSENNSEAFAGLHEDNVMVLYDEASAIADVIWDVTAGAMTTPGAIWIATGNPTRNSGRFRECFPGGKFAQRWKTRQVDSRTAKMTNKKQLQDWIDDYGEDSDFVRVRIKGEFPRAGSTQFIPSDLVDRAMALKLETLAHAVKVMGVDVARFGDDQTVITKRHGNQVEAQLKFRGLDTMEVVAVVVQEYNAWAPHAIFVDGNGIGAGVVDRLRQLGLPVIDVQFGAKARAEEKYFNKRAECWGEMLAWLKGEVVLPADDGLRAALVGIEYGYDNKMRIQLEKKDDMKKRGLDSPDEGDSLALTFAMPVNLVRMQAHGRSDENLRRARRERDWRAV